MAQTRRPEVPMQITLERGGGVAGGANHSRLGPVDTAAADEDTRRRIEALVAELDFFGLDDDFPRERRMSDATWHSVRVEDDGRDRTLRWDLNQTIPEGIRELRDLAASLGEWEDVSGR
jgi:hypothetical protein